MKHNYLKRPKRILTFTMLLLGLTTYAQDIHFTFANAQNTNESGNDYYEVDVMIQTINATGSFKLGSGQLYFTYSTAAFGANVNAGSNFEVTQPDDYICGQGIDLSSAIKIYGSFTTNDNTTSRVSWAFSQTFSSSTFAADNVSDTPAKLCHIKMKYANVNETPMFLFEDGSTYDDQFYSACGLATGGTTGTADCGAEPGTQFLNDTFESNGATLSNSNFELLAGVTLYPNPAREVIFISSDQIIEKIELYDIIGKQILTTKETLEVRVNYLQKGLYLLKLYSGNTSVTKKITIE